MRIQVLTAVVLSSLLVPVGVVAAPGHERPRITEMRWKHAPVTAAEEGCETDCHEEILVVRAHDPDSSITEIQVHFGEGQSVVFAHTYCLQGKKPGEPARLEIPVSYTEVGTYDVRAVAYSHRRCKPHVRGDGHPSRHSRVRHLKTTVEAAPEEAVVSTDRARYLRGEEVTIRLANESDRAVTVEGPIEVVALDAQETVARDSGSTSRTIPSGGSIEWRWDQRRRECVEDCRPPDIDSPSLVDAGRYLVRVRSDAGVIQSRFSIGQYFTLGFRNSSARLSLFSIGQDVNERLETEAQSREKTLIVAGLVRRGRVPYNPSWRFHLLPRSIVFGEVFTEVCDATPFEVQDRLDAWAGRQWCPWSSYVMSAGRPS